MADFYGGAGKTQRPGLLTYLAQALAGGLQGNERRDAVAKERQDALDAENRAIQRQDTLLQRQTLQARAESTRNQFTAARDKLAQARGALTDPKEISEIDTILQGLDNAIMGPDDRILAAADIGVGKILGRANEIVFGVQRREQEAKQKQEQEKQAKLDREAAYNRAKDAVAIQLPADAPAEQRSRAATALFKMNSWVANGGDMPTDAFADLGPIGDEILADVLKGKNPAQLYEYAQKQGLIQRDGQFGRVTGSSNSGQTPAGAPEGFISPTQEATSTETFTPVSATLQRVLGNASEDDYFARPLEAAQRDLGPYSDPKVLSAIRQQDPAVADELAAVQSQVSGPGQTRSRVEAIRSIIPRAAQAYGISQAAEGNREILKQAGLAGVPLAEIQKIPGIDLKRRLTASEEAQIAKLAFDAKTAQITKEQDREVQLNMAQGTLNNFSQRLDQRPEGGGATLRERLIAADPALGGLLGKIVEAKSPVDALSLISQVLGSEAYQSIAAEETTYGELARTLGISKAMTEGELLQANLAEVPLRQRLLQGQLEDRDMATVRESNAAFMNNLFGSSPGKPSLQTRLTARGGDTAAVVARIQSAKTDGERAAAIFDLQNDAGYKALMREDTALFEADKAWTVRMRNLEEKKTVVDIDRAELDYKIGEQTYKIKEAELGQFATRNYLDITTNFASQAQAGNIAFFDSPTTQKIAKELGVDLAGYKALAAEPQKRERAKGALASLDSILFNNPNADLSQVKPLLASILGQGTADALVRGKRQEAAAAQAQREIEMDAKELGITVAKEQMNQMAWERSQRILENNQDENFRWTTFQENVRQFNESNKVSWASVDRSDARAVTQLKQQALSQLNQARDNIFSGLNIRAQQINQAEATLKTEMGLSQADRLPDLRKLTPQQKADFGLRVQEILRSRQALNNDTASAEKWYADSSSQLGQPVPNFSAPLNLDGTVDPPENKDLPSGGSINDATGRNGARGFTPGAQAVLARFGFQTMTQEYGANVGAPGYGPEGNIGLDFVTGPDRKITNPFAGATVVYAGEGKGLQSWAGTNIGNWGSELGNVIALRLPGGEVVTLSHTAKWNVRPGQVLREGDVVGTMGNTGNVRSSNGGDGSHVDTMWFMPDAQGNLQRVKGPGTNATISRILERNANAEAPAGSGALVTIPQNILGNLSATNAYLRQELPRLQSRNAPAAQPAPSGVGPAPVVQPDSRQPKVAVQQVSIPSPLAAWANDKNNPNNLRLWNSYKTALASGNDGQAVAVASQMQNQPGFPKADFNAYQNNVLERRGQPAPQAATPQAQPAARPAVPVPQPIAAWAAQGNANGVNLRAFEAAARAGNVAKMQELGAAMEKAGLSRELILQYGNSLQRK